MGIFKFFLPNASRKPYGLLFVLVLWLMPILSIAQSPNPGYFIDALEQIIDVINDLLPVAVGIALLAFFWGSAKFIFNAGNQRAVDQGKNIMIWGVIALFVIVSIWGIVGLLGDIFDIGQGGEVAVPGVDDPISGQNYNGPLFDIIEGANGMLHLLLPIVVGLATLFFFWGMAKFIFAAGNEAAIVTGKRQMFWGIIALFVIVSVWGIVELLQNVFDVDSSEACPPPQIGQNSVSTCN